MSPRRSKMAASMGNNIFTAVLIFSASSTFLSTGSCERTLKLVNMIYRHGNRSPVVGYPTDNYTEDTWSQGFGQLTQTGMAQHYELGQWLRQRYVTELKLFDGFYRPNQVYVRSTPRERTIMSAQSNLQGLFPHHSGGGKSVSGTPPWPPVPVFTVALDQDYMMSISRASDCEAAGDYFQAIENSEVKQKYIRENQTFFSRVQQETGLGDGAVFWNFSHIGDTLVREKTEGRRLPDWADNETYNRLKATLDFAFEAEFSNMTTDEKKIHSGVLLAAIVDSMKAHLNRTNNESRIFMYSGHDTNVAPFLAMFGAFNNIQPPTASCVMVELYREDDGSYTVQLLFRNDTSRPPYLLRFADCNERCPVQNFFHIASQYVVYDINHICRRKLPSYRLDFKWNIGWILAMSSLVFTALLPLIVCVILLLGIDGRRRLRLSKQRLQPINFHLLGGPNSESEDESVFDT